MGKVDEAVRVRVTWTPEDHWALAHFSLLKTPLYGRTRRLAHLATAVVFAGSLGPAAAAALLAPLGLSPWSAGNAGFLVMLLMGLAGWVIAPVFYKAYVRWRVMGSVKNLPGALGEQRIVLTPEGIHRENQAGEETTRWSVITDVVEDIRHVYLFAGPGAAYVFPKRDVNEEQQAAIKAMGTSCSTGRPSVLAARPMPALERVAYILGGTIVAGAAVAALLLLLLT